MASRFEVGLTLGQLEKDLLAMGNSAPAIMARALNRAGTSGKTAMVRGVAASTGIRQKRISDDIRISKASRNDLKFVLDIRGRRLPLIEFKAKGPEPSRGRGRGVSWTNEGQTKREPHAFIAAMPQGHRGVFIRTRFTAAGARFKPHGTSKRTGRPLLREVIEELFGPSIPHVFEKQIPVFQAASQESLIKNLVHEIGFERSRLQGSE